MRNTEIVFKKCIDVSLEISISEVKCGHVSPQEYGF